MRVLLPPSEAKHPGGRGRPLRVRAAHPSLGAAREDALTALETLLSGPRADAAAALLLPPAVADDALEMNRRVRDARTAPALARYAGVVYAGLASAELTPAEQRLAGRMLLIFSGLFGVVRGDEAVPPYRVPAKAALPGLGVAATFWRPVLDATVPTLVDRGLIVDLRSSDYTAMWRPRARLVEQTVRVRILSPLPSGRRGVVSYPSKLAKGQLAAALVRRVAAGRSVRAVDDVAAAWLEAGGPHAEIRADADLVLHTA